MSRKSKGPHVELISILKCESFYRNSKKLCATVLRLFLQFIVCCARMWRMIELVLTDILISHSMRVRLFVVHAPKFDISVASIKIGLISMGSLGEGFPSFVTLFHSSRNSVANQPPASQDFVMVFGNCFLDTSQIPVLDIREPFELAIAPVPDHPNISDHPATGKLRLKLLFLDFVWQVFGEEHSAPDWHSGFLNSLLLSFGRLDSQIPVFAVFPTLGKCTIIVLLVIEFHMSIASTSPCILVPRHLDVSNSLRGLQENPYVLLLARVGNAIDKNFVQLFVVRGLFDFLTHPQSYPRLFCSIYFYNDKLCLTSKHCLSNQTTEFINLSFHLSS